MVRTKTHPAKGLTAIELLIVVGIVAGTSYLKPESIIFGARSLYH
jgi:hypothetical protein